MKKPVEPKKYIFKEVIQWRKPMEFPWGNLNRFLVQKKSGFICTALKVDGKFIEYNDTETGKDITKDVELISLFPNGENFYRETGIDPIKWQHLII